MYCNKCGAQINGSNYCLNCGGVIASTTNNLTNQFNNQNVNTNIPSEVENETSQANANNDRMYQAVVKKDDKKYAIISISICALFWILFFAGFSFSYWIILVLFSFSINLATKSKNSSPVLYKIAFGTNLASLIITIIFLIIQIIASLT